MLLAACHAGSPPAGFAPIAPGASGQAELGRREQDAQAVAPAKTLGESAAVPRRVRSTCREPLAALCQDSACRTYTAARDTAEKSAEGYNPALCTGLCAGEVHVGECGELRYFQDGDCLCGTTQYFDVEGRLVGGNRWSDYRGYCAHTSFTAEYGRVPSGCP
jgi:hypothetical protein